MVRPVKYEFIDDESVRRQTFQKRKAGLLKKVSELITLCSVEACVVIYGPPTSAQPDFWPSESEARRLFEKFNKLPTMSKITNTMDQKKFLGQNTSRVSNNLENQEKKNQRVQMENIMTKSLVVENYLANYSNLGDLKDVVHFLDEKIKKMNDRNENIKHDKNEIGSGSKHGKEKQSL